MSRALDNVHPHIADPRCGGFGDTPSQATRFCLSCHLENYVLHPPHSVHIRATTQSQPQQQHGSYGPTGMIAHGAHSAQGSHNPQITTLQMSRT